MNLERNQIIGYLNSSGVEKGELLRKAAGQRDLVMGNIVFFRGLVEFSNHCSKNCYYCGIRRGNRKVLRYEVTDEEILEACRFARDNNYGSVVLQSGEVSSAAFIKRVENLLKQIKGLPGDPLGITLSCGEQSRETYRRWFEAGAHRYLLRIETSDRVLYKKLHPENSRHDFEKRIESLQWLRETGYQVGSGVMIGLPFQTIESLADDLLFLQKLDIDMCGMGPYIEHEETPLYRFRHFLLPREERLELALKMVAVLRLMMPDINIASSTALQAIHPKGREMALEAGANIIMPNLTPVRFRHGYVLYDNKPGLDLDAIETDRQLRQGVINAGCRAGTGNWGDSLHFLSKR